LKAYGTPKMVTKKLTGILIDQCSYETFLRQQDVKNIRL